MYADDSFKKKEFYISEDIWEALINGETLNYSSGTPQPATFKILLNSGYKIIRNDGRLLGYDVKEDKFFDTKKYLDQKKNHIPSFVFDKSTVLTSLGIITYLVIVLGGRFMLAEKNMPLVTPGTLYMLPFPDRLEYLEKELQSMDSINIHEEKDRSTF